MPSNNTILASSSGSIIQLICSSIPIFIVLLFFLYSAYTRPNKPIYQAESSGYDDDLVLKNALDATGALIPLIQMIDIFLIFFVMASMLLSYILIFIPKRRKLIEYYLENGKSIIGNVYYIEHPNNILSKINQRMFCCCPRHYDYAYVTYLHPLDHSVMIKKHVRTYQRYTRENVSIKVLDIEKYPTSGLPEQDIQIDISTYDTSGQRDKIPSITKFLLFWIIFTLLSPLYIIYQIITIETIDEKLEDTESSKVAWIHYGIGVGVIMPLFAFIWNYCSWKYYEYGLLKKCTLLKSSSYNNISSSQREEMIFNNNDNDDNAGDYVAMDDEENNNNNKGSNSNSNIKAYGAVGAINHIFFSCTDAAASNNTSDDGYNNDAAALTTAAGGGGGRRSGGTSTASTKKARNSSRKNKSKKKDANNRQIELTSTGSSGTLETNRLTAIIAQSRAKSMKMMNNSNRRRDLYRSTYDNNNADTFDDDDDDDDDYSSRGSSQYDTFDDDYDSVESASYTDADTIERRRSLQQQRQQQQQQQSSRRNKNNNKSNKNIDDSKTMSSWAHKKIQRMVQKV